MEEKEQRDVDDMIYVDEWRENDRIRQTGPGRSAFVNR